MLNGALMMVILMMMMVITEQFVRFIPNIFAFQDENGDRSCNKSMTRPVFQITLTKTSVYTLNSEYSSRCLPWSDSQGGWHSDSQGGSHSRLDLEIFLLKNSSTEKSYSKHKKIY